MSNYINSSNRSFGICSICQTEQIGYPKTFSSLIFIDSLGAVRVNDEVVADCGHSGYVTSGSSVTNENGNPLATTDSQILGDYIASFMDNVSYMGES